jgi:hypothetical protein
MDGITYGLMAENDKDYGKLIIIKMRIYITRIFTYTHQKIYNNIFILYFFGFRQLSLPELSYNRYFYSVLLIQFVFVSFLSHYPV